MQTPTMKMLLGIVLVVCCAIQAGGVEEKTAEALKSETKKSRPVYNSKIFPSFDQWKKEIDQLPYLSQLAVAKEIKHYVDTQYAIFGAVAGASLKNLTFDEFYRVLSQFFTTMSEGSINNKQHWLNPHVTWKGGIPQIPNSNTAAMAPTEDFFNPEVKMARNPFVQKLSVPIGSKIILHGDLHGDAHSLVNSLASYMEEKNGFRLREDVYVIFLGDYVDRGLYGLECIYTLMRLKIDNPDRVFMVRGNHEDEEICTAYGFRTELEKKSFNNEQISTLFRLYDILPVALFLGSGNNFMQLCHGGWELGYRATSLLNAQDPVEYEWVNELNRAAIFSQLDDILQGDMQTMVEENPLWFKDKTIPAANTTGHVWINNKKVGITLGFMWNDYAVKPQQDVSLYCGRGFTFNKNITEQLLKLTNTGNNKLCGIIRAHQHTPQPDEMMSLLLNLNGKDEANKGIAKLWARADQKGSNLWQNIVVTFNMCPDTLYGIPHQGFGYGHKLVEPWPGFDFDTTGELVTDIQFERWTLIVKRKKITDLNPIIQFIKEKEEKRMTEQKKAEASQESEQKTEEDVCSWR